MSRCFRNGCKKEANPKLKHLAQGESSCLYNGMIASLIPYAIRGAIWYQGESNASRAKEYRDLFPFMIEHWRKEWQQGDFPFYWVQLADFKAYQPEPIDSDWAELREAQTLTMKKLPHTGQCVITDLGEANDIHPKNKRDVAERLAPLPRGIHGDRQPFEDGPRIDFGRIGLRGRPPGDAVGVGAAGSGVAIAHHPRILTPQLQRRNPRLRSPLEGRNLIERHPGMDVRPRRVFGRRTGQEAARGLGMTAAAHSRCGLV